MARCTIVALALALLPSPALAQTIAAGQTVSASFAPPLDHEVRYQVVETRHRQGLTLVFRLDQRVRFTRQGSGYRMTVTMHSAKAEAPAAIAQRFDAAFRPFVGLDIALLLSENGQPLGLADEAGTWQRLLGAIEKLRADTALKAEVPDGIEAVLAGIAALPPEARAARLMENPMRLIGYALPAVAPGDSIARGDAREGASATLQSVEPTALTYVIRSRRQLEQGVMLTSESDLVVERKTGLLLRSGTRERVVADQRPVDGAPDTVIDVRRMP